MRVLCLYFAEIQEIQKIAEIFYRLSPQIAVRENQAIFLEISKCKSLYSELGVMARVRALLRRLQLPVNLALAGDIPTALAKAFYQEREKEKLPISALPFFSNPFQTEQSKPLEKMLLSLERLGVPTLGDFLKLPRNQLTSRFGALGSYLHQRGQDASDLLWPPFFPEETVSEFLEFDGEILLENLEPILFHLKTLLDKVNLRLRARGERPRVFRLTLKQENLSIVRNRDYSVEIALSLPHASAKSVLGIAQEKLDHALRTKPLEAGVVGLGVEVLESVPYSSSQKDLFHPKREEEEEAYAQLVTRLSLRLGQEHVFQAVAKESYLPEKNWEKIYEPQNPAPIEDRLPRRPLRVLKEPRPLQFLGKYLLLEKTRFEVIGNSQKEIVFSDWWDAGKERIYFRAQTKNGQELWLFRSAAGLFLHGYFD